MGVVVCLQAMAEVLRGRATGLELVKPIGRKASLIKKSDMRRMLTYIFEEGVIVVHKQDKFLEHPELKGIPNLHVKLCVKSLVSKGYLDEYFCWQHHYYVLNASGLDFLRNELCMGPQVFPDPTKLKEELLLKFSLKIIIKEIKRFKNN